MAQIKTLKHELVYDSTTKRAIFNQRNQTANVPTQDGFPERLTTRDIIYNLEYTTHFTDTELSLAFAKGHIVNSIKVSRKEDNKVLVNIQLISIDLLVFGSPAYGQPDTLIGFDMYSDNISDFRVNLGNEYTSDELDIELTFLKLENEYSYEM